MDQRQLSEAILEGGIRSINFFNGRLLSGDDLGREQEANRAARQRLGQAIGAGGARGLEGSTSADSKRAAPMVTIGPGLAISRQGHALALSGTLTLSLVRRPDRVTTTALGFHDCAPPQGGVYVAGQGLYLLAIAPASLGEGRAPVSGLGNTAAACNTRYIVEAVQFRLIAVDMANDLGLDSTARGNAARLRNRIAYACFGVAARQALLADPFGSAQRTDPFVSRADPLDALRPSRLTDCDVPLALIYVTDADGMVFVDNWSVRRPLEPSEGQYSTPALANEPLSGRYSWGALLGERWSLRVASTMLQFDEQVSQIREKEASAMPTIAALDRFGYLPPAGIIPIGRTMGAAGGFDLETFFGNRASRDVALIDAGQLRALLREALDHEPIDVNATGKIQLYRIWENVKTIEAGSGAQPALVFASSMLRYRGVARFGRAKVGRSRAAPSVI